MILTAIIACGDGMGFTVDREYEELAAMFGEELRDRGDTYEVFDVDDITLVQRGRTRLFHRGAELDPAGRVYVPSPISMCPVRERKLANIYYVLLEQGLPLLNRSFAASPELEVNKTVMQALVADLDIPCVPTMDLAPHMSPEDLLAAAGALGFGLPMILKPNRLSHGIGILRCHDRPDFIEQVRLIQRLKADYLLQDYVPHIGDLRTFLSRDGMFGHRLRKPAGSEFRANFAFGAKWHEVELPAKVEEWSLRIAARCHADYIVIDWLMTGTCFVFNEMCSTIGGFVGVPADMKTRLANTILDIGRRKLGASLTPGSADRGRDRRLSP
jgi:glutathione synthase/RimK-type ligase-like ATP-grasp enzyme